MLLRGNEVLYAIVQNNFDLEAFRSHRKLSIAESSTIIEELMSKIEDLLPPNKDRIDIELSVKISKQKRHLMSAYKAKYETNKDAPGDSPAPKPSRSTKKGTDDSTTVPPSYPDWEDSLEYADFIEEFKNFSEIALEDSNESYCIAYHEYDMGAKEQRALKKTICDQEIKVKVRDCHQSTIKLGGAST